jgi:hypothetical protein
MSGMSGHSTRRPSEREFSYCSPSSVQPHPFSAKLYGKEKLNKDFVESVRSLGVLTPITFARMSFDGGKAWVNYVISGHRRLQAAIEVGVKRIPCRDITFEGAVGGASHGTPEYFKLEMEHLVIDANRQRVKTPEQKAREFKELKRIESALAKERETARKKSEKSEAKPKTKPADARKTAAAAVGLKPSTADKLEDIVDAADAGDLKARENLDAVNAGTKSVNAAALALPGQFECSQCNENFNTRLALHQHRQTHKTIPSETVSAPQTPLQEQIFYVLKNGEDGYFDGSEDGDCIDEFAFAEHYDTKREAFAAMREANLEKKHWEVVEIHTYAVGGNTAASAPPAAETVSVPTAVPTTCSLCAETLPSKTKWGRHVRLSHPAEADSILGQQTAPASPTLSGIPVVEPQAPPAVGGSTPTLQLQYSSSVDSAAIPTLNDGIIQSISDDLERMVKRTIKVVTPGIYKSAARVAALRVMQETVNKKLAEAERAYSPLM